MSTDEFLIDEFKKSDVYSNYLSPELSLDDIVSWQVPGIMYLLLIELAKESRLGLEENEKISKTLREELVETMCSQLEQHEGILILQSILGGKFYRDHLKHMLRVMLLGHLIATKLEINNQELIATSLAGLFHDFAYPLSKAGQTINTIAESYNRWYPYLDIQVGNLQIDNSGYSELSKVIQRSPYSCTLSITSENRTNHGILSASAFLNLWRTASIVKNDKELLDLIYQASQSIAIHDSEINVSVKYSVDSVSTILILADEMQDWGRPVGWDESSWKPIEEIEDLRITKGEIEASFNYSESDEYYEKSYKTFSPLLQIQSKQHNLARLSLDNGFPELRLHYKLPKYHELCWDSFLSIMEELQRIELIISEEIDKYTFGGPMISELPIEIQKLKHLRDAIHLKIKELIEVLNNSERQFHLFVNVFTGEYVIQTDNRMPKEIVAKKEDTGEISWSKRIKSLNKSLEAKPFPLPLMGLEFHRMIDIFSSYPIDLDSGLNDLQSLDVKGTAPDFITLIQLIPCVYKEIHEAWKEYFKEDFPNDQLSKETIDWISVLYRSCDQRCRFFLLKEW